MKGQDIIIVGGGPSGCILSILLARSGLNVTLLEKDTHLDRTFRGPLYQPSAIRIWDELGILKQIQTLDHATFQDFSFIRNGKILFKMDLSDMPEPYNYMFVVKQAPLLRCLIQHALQYPNFTYLGGCRAEGVLSEEGGVAGVIAKTGDFEHILKSRLVVAADGRFSTLREAIGCQLERAKQRFDVVWFELPNLHNISFDVGFQMTDDGFLVFLPKEENLIQIGLVLGKGKFPDLRKRGIEAFTAQIAKAKPEIKTLLEEYITSWESCELLDVKIAIAKEWSHDGMLLIGDAAHVASPVGGLGNKLAIEDAVIAHPLIVKALKSSQGIISKEVLKEFETVRRPDITTTLRFQKIIGKIVIETTNPFVVWIRNKIAPYLQKTPIYRKIRNLVTMSPHPIHVDTKTFTHDELEYPLLEVINIIKETPQTKTFYFKIPNHLSDSFSFKSGQHITMRIVINGIAYSRCYSLSSSEDSGNISITVKTQDQGTVSKHLNEQVSVGDFINISRPSGIFALSDNKAKQYLFFAGGSGITPVFSMISTLLKNDLSVPIHLFYVNHNKEMTIFYNAIKNLQKQYPNFTVSDVFTTPEDASWTGLKGRPDEKMIADDCRKRIVTGTTYYLCGPKQFMDLVRGVLVKEGVDNGSIHQETFYSLKGPQDEAVSLYSNIVKAGSSLKDHENEIPEKVIIELRGEQHTLKINKETAILDAALDAGLNAPFSCQEGICGTCRATLKEGRVEMETHDALTDEEIDQKKILTCQAKPRSRICRVSYDE